jgi:uncharacterized HAD superfamily protein
MQLIIDLDGTICTEEKTFSRSLAKPLPGAIEGVNQLYDEGHIVIIYSARSWSEYEMTAHWLRTNGVRYHQLVMGKPVGDVWIDDRAIRFRSWNETMQMLGQDRIRQ